MAWLQSCVTLLALVVLPGVSSAQQDETPRDASDAQLDDRPTTPEQPPAGDAEEPATAEIPTAAPVPGPLYVVTHEGDSAEEVREIYREGDLAFLNFFWWWVVLIAGLAGVGGVAYWIWGRRRPKRASRL